MFIVDVIVPATHLRDSHMTRFEVLESSFTAWAKQFLLTGGVITGMRFIPMGV